MPKTVATTLGGVRVEEDEAAVGLLSNGFVLALALVLLVNVGTAAYTAMQRGLDLVCKSHTASTDMLNQRK